MSIRSAVISEIQQIGGESKKALPPLTDDLVLLHSGLDSLAIAILVTRLEDTLGLDPFTESDDVSYPVTLGDFIRFYEDAANKDIVNSQRVG
jgi:acyl carrier protein